MGRASAEESGTGRGRRKPFAGRGAAPGWARPTRTFFFADWPFTRWTLTLDGPARVIPRMAATFVATPDARPRRAFPTAFISSAVPTKPTRATPRARAPEPRRDLPRRHASRSPLADRRTHLVRRRSPEVATACAARRAVGTLMVRLFFPLISRSVGRCSTAGRGETPMPRRLFRLGCPMVPRESASASWFFTAIVERARATAAVAYHARGAERPRARSGTMFALANVATRGEPRRVSLGRGRRDVTSLASRGAVPRWPTAKSVSSRTEGCRGRRSAVAPRAYLSRPSQRSRLDMTVSLPLNRQLTRSLVLSCWLYRRVVLPFPRATAEVAREGDTRAVESALVPLGRRRRALGVLLRIAAKVRECAPAFATFALIFACWYVRLAAFAG